jgi:predicted GIY-YIG superfamily endonuclease
MTAKAASQYAHNHIFLYIMRCQNGDTVEGYNKIVNDAHVTQRRENHNQHSTLHSKPTAPQKRNGFKRQNTA